MKLRGYCYSCKDFYRLSIRGRKRDACPICHGDLTTMWVPKGEAAREDVQQTLAGYDRDDFETYVRALREEELLRAAPDPDEDVSTPRGEWLRSDAGMPLGRGMPTGLPIDLPLAGDPAASVGAHRERWKLVVRRDPCAYCGTRLARTVDHIEPQSRRTHMTETWLNFTGACRSCNGHKGSMNLLRFLLSRRHQPSNIVDYSTKEAA